MRKFMIKKTTKLFLVASILTLAGILYSIQTSYDEICLNSEQQIKLSSSSGLEGSEDILITEILRNVNVSGSGVITIADRLKILNNYNNPIPSILVGIPLKLVDNLIYFKATGSNGNSLFSERKNLIMYDNEMITIYFDSPILPNQGITITFTHSYVKIPLFYLLASEQQVDYSMNPFPLLPYKTEKEVRAIFRMPEASEVIEFDQVADIGVQIVDNILSYDLSESFELDYLNPFLENLQEEEKEIMITYKYAEMTEMQVEYVQREIFLSAWGIIRIREDILIKNIGVLPISSLTVNIPKSSKNLYVYDDIGELDASDLRENQFYPQYSSFSINLAGIRAIIIPNSKYQFSIEYKLPFEEFTSVNWIEQSVKIDLFTTLHEFYVMEESINFVIEGCNSITSLSLNPNSISQSRGSTTISYFSENVSPIETLMVQINFTVDLFDLLLRPFIIILIFALIMSLYVVIIKARKKQEEKEELRGEFIPYNEIREFCSLYEEKNALTLEIRRAGIEAKRKKMAKKTYKNILAKNSVKIEQIKQEILPFKKNLMDTNETFENIVKKLDVLDAERISVDDSLNLLETRYKRGRLPSKAAYQKLSDDFEKRRKKVDRTIDKLIQQLRSYLL